MVPDHIFAERLVLEGFARRTIAERLVLEGFARRTNAERVVFEGFARRTIADAYYSTVLPCLSWFKLSRLV